MIKEITEEMQHLLIRDLKNVTHCRADFSSESSKTTNAFNKIPDQLSSGLLKAAILLCQFSFFFFLNQRILQENFDREFTIKLIKLLRER